MATISIIIPVYKVENTLKRCLDSVLCQTHTDFECLLIDDGSPDNSGAICDEYAKKDSRIKVFHKENGGVSSARNLGLDNANGKYVVFIDSDDWVTHSFLETLLNNVGEYDVVSAGYEILYKMSSMFVVPANEELNFCNEKNDKIVKSIYYGNFRGLFCKLFKKDIIDSNNIRFIEGIPFGEDTIFVYTYLAHCKNAKTISNKVYFYDNRNPSSAVKKFRKDMILYRQEILSSVKNLANSILCLDDKAKSTLISREGFSAFHYCTINYFKCEKEEAIDYYKQAYLAFSDHVKDFGELLKNKDGLALSLVNKKDIKEYLYISSTDDMQKIYNYKKRQARNRKLCTPFRKAKSLLKKIF